MAALNDQLAATADEWKGWQTVVDNFRHTIGDVNDPQYDGLVKAMRVWAELLVALRVLQSEEVRTIARTEALAAYLSHTP